MLTGIVRDSFAIADLRPGPSVPRALLLAALVLVACKGGTSEAPDPTAAEFAQQSDAPADAESESPAPGAQTDASASAVTTEQGAGDQAVRPAKTIYRSEVLRVTNFGPAYLLRELQPEPFRHSGRFVGWEIMQVFPDDPALCEPGCDLLVGDVVLSVNGSRLETPQQLSDEFGKLPERTTLTVVLLRNEKRHAVTYTIVEDVG